LHASFLSQKLRVALAGLVVAALSAVASASAASAAGADLQLTLSAATQARLGDTIAYVAQVRNAGPESATSVRVNVELPAQAVLTSAAASQGVCSTSAAAATSTAGTPQPAPFQCFIGPLGIGEQARVTIVARVTGTGTLAGKVSVTADQADPNTQNNQAELATSVSSTATGGADLQLTLAGPGQARLGDTIRYVAQVRNRGPQEATSVKLSEQFSAQVRLVRLNTSRGTCVTGAAAAGGSSASLTCSLGKLRPGAEARFAIVVQATAAGSLTNSATVSADQTDPNTPNNQAQATTTVAGSLPAAGTGADLRLNLTGPRHAPGGSLIRYIAHIHNRGPAAATSVKLSDDFSGAVAKVLSVAASQGSCAPAVVTATTAGGATASGTPATAATITGKKLVVRTAAVTTCDIGTLAAGAEARVAFVVRAHSRGRVTVSASISADGSDPSVANNRASLTTQLNGPRHKGHDRDHGKGKHHAKGDNDNKE
jgi:uncharacterized repeat protein (TIGR01451 family)